MKKTIIKVAIALAVCAVTFFGIKTFLKPDGIQGAKEVTITIDNLGENVGTIKARTDTELLSDFLLELKEKGKIQFEYEDSQFGMFITGIGIDELITQNEKDEQYWIYSSSNNKACLATGYGCDAASVVVIEDGDVFDFHLQQY